MIKSFNLQSKTEGQFYRMTASVLPMHNRNDRTNKMNLSTPVIKGQVSFLTFSFNFDFSSIVKKSKRYFKVFPEAPLEATFTIHNNQKNS